MRICQEYADENRKMIAKQILDTYGLEAQEEFTTVHNYIDHESNIIRKGAVSARKDEKLLIPINMRDGSLLCVGKGNEDWNCSAPHGAGRLFSRSAARNEFGNVPKDVIRSSGPDDFLRSWGVSEENTDIIMNFLHGRW